MPYSSSYLAFEIPILIEEIYLTILNSYPYTEFMKKNMLDFQLLQLKNYIKTENIKDWTLDLKCENIEAEIQCFQRKEKFFKNILTNFEKEIFPLKTNLAEKVEDVIQIVKTLLTYYGMCRTHYTQLREQFIKFLQANDLVSDNNSELVDQTALKKFQFQYPMAAFEFEYLRTKLFIFKNLTTLFMQVDYLNE